MLRGRFNYKYLIRNNIKIRFLSAISSVGQLHKPLIAQILYILWNAERYPDAIYYYTLQAGEQIANGKMMKVRQKYHKTTIRVFCFCNVLYIYNLPFDCFDIQYPLFVVGFSLPLIFAPLFHSKGLSLQVGNLIS